MAYAPHSKKKRHPLPSVTASSLWLAAGDEVGNWDLGRDGGFRDETVGVVWVLGSADAWIDALQSDLGGMPALDVFSRPFAVSAGGALDSPKDKYHVSDVWNYCRNKDITGPMDPTRDHSDPVLDLLLKHLRWLAQDSGLATLAVTGSTDDARQAGLHQTRDSLRSRAAALAVLFDVARPFLPNDALCCCLVEGRTEAMSDTGGAARSLNAKSFGKRLEEPFRDFLGFLEERQDASVLRWKDLFPGGAFAECKFDGKAGIRAVLQNSPGLVPEFLQKNAARVVAAMNGIADLAGVFAGRQPAVGSVRIQTEQLGGAGNRWIGNFRDLAINEPADDRALIRIGVTTSSLAALPPRPMELGVAGPLPLLAPKREQTPEGADGFGSEWLGAWGWQWKHPRNAYRIGAPYLRPWLRRVNLDVPFDPRAAILAARLRLKTEQACFSPKLTHLEPESLARALAEVTPESLREALAQALVMADDKVFDFADAAPQWPDDLRRARFERDDEIRRRKPAPAWLAQGYALASEGFRRLRSQAATHAEAQAILDDIAQGRDLPFALALVFWWEAVYVLTERGALAEAQKAQQQLDRVAQGLQACTGLVDPLWQHQQGRLAYYVGNLPEALRAYAAQWQRIGAYEPSRRVIVARDIANVLSDLGCLATAHRFAEHALTLAREQALDKELFKTLGRLGEIAIKAGRLEEAHGRYLESLEIQQRLGERHLAQTLCYLGHVAVLRGQSEEARRYYAEAEREDTQGYSRPYRLMGQFGLAAHERDANALVALWQENEHALCRLWLEGAGPAGADPTLALPAATAIFAAATRLPAAQAWRQPAVEGLLRSHYLVEAACACLDLDAAARAALAPRTVSRLDAWEKALAPVALTLDRERIKPDSQLSALAHALREGKPERWLRRLAYPLNLVPDNV